jgi:hypothetical protein
MWRPVESPWQYRVLDATPSGIDLAQLEATRRLSPQERVVALMKLMQVVEELQLARKTAGPCRLCGAEKPGEDLIRSKAAAGRAKDLLDLEALRKLKP